MNCRYLCHDDKLRKYVITVNPVMCLGIKTLQLCGLNPMRDHTLSFLRTCEGVSNRV